MQKKIVARPTIFQKRVYAALRCVPRGRVTTYQLLAQHIHCRSCRAIGQALKHNPDAPRTPCHRVIASDLTPGGFHGQRNRQAQSAKLRLLSAEGVRFRSGKLLDPLQIFNFHLDPNPPQCISVEHEPMAGR